MNIKGAAYTVTCLPNNTMVIGKKIHYIKFHFRSVIPDDSPALIELLREFVSSSSLSILLMSMSSNVISSNPCSVID